MIPFPQTPHGQRHKQNVVGGGSDFLVVALSFRLFLWGLVRSYEATLRVGR